jgi:hypothetical protein
VFEFFAVFEVLEVLTTVEEFEAELLENLPLASRG